MNNQFLSLALGHFLAEFDGLRQIALPPKLPLEVGMAIANAANSKREEGEVFAIVVTENVYDQNSEAGIFSPNDSVAYREGDRLAVLVNGVAQSASNLSSFVSLLNPAFPATGSYRFDFQSLVEQIMNVVLAESGINAAIHPTQPEDIERLNFVLTLLAGAYESSEEGQRPWNVLWFEHVNGGLSNLVKNLRAAPKDLKVGELLSHLTFSSFSLPIPDNGESYSAKNSSGRSIWQALTSHWYSKDNVLETLAIIQSQQHTGKGEIQALLDLNWDEFEDKQIASGNALHAFGTFSGASLNERTHAFSQLVEGDFFSPLGEVESDRTLRVETRDGISLTVSTTDKFIAETVCDGDTVFSQEVRVRLPTIAVPTQSQIDSSEVTIDTSTKGLEFIGQLTLDVDSVFAEGIFRWKSAKNVTLYKFNLTTISVSVPNSDSLAGTILSDSKATGFFIPHVGAGCVIFPQQKGKYGKPIWVPKAKIEDLEPGEEPAILECPLNNGGDHLVICWTDSQPTLPQMKNAVFEVRLGSSERLFESHAILGDGDLLYAGDTVIEFEIPEPSSVVEKEGRGDTPIVSAIKRSRTSNFPPTSAAMDTLRGAVEEKFLNLLDTGVWKENLGHIAMPGDGVTTLTELIPSECKGYLVPSDFQQQLQRNSNFRIPTELLESNELREFIIAFEELEIQEKLTYVDDNSGEALTKLPSSHRWDSLWQNNELLENYLIAYTGLIKRASNLNAPSSAAVFWATFPFSVASWNSTNGNYRCESVHLSPLHPLRLAWLSCTEHTFFNASLAGQLAATIEGWNLPLLAPSEANGGIMIAISSDTGPDQFFTGWSMMVTAPVGMAEPLKVPEFVGSYRTPGASSSGLNGSAVVGALTEFKKMNAHASTITIDLAAASPSNRSADIDSAVVSGMKNWFGRKNLSTPGGMRVLDSLNRRGDIPREFLLDTLGADAEIPMTWSRYEPDQRNVRSSNLRFLQDAGVALNVNPNPLGGDGYGLMTDIPLKRFEVRDPVVVDNAGVSKPAIDVNLGWEPFTSALRAVESPTSGPVIHTQIQGGVINDGSADWTITGESLISPAVLAALMRSSNSASQMLWEWKPPFLNTDVNSLSLLDRRPYLSIVRTPDAFRTRIRTVLTKALNREATDSDVDSLLSTLGARGVGLASLVSAGGTQATGALGFYAALQLMTKTEIPSVHRFVLPLDACEEFLWRLTNEGTLAASRKRADLLLLEVGEKYVSFSPLEIKYWGANVNEDVALLPKVESAKVLDALEQARSTYKILESVGNQSAELPVNSADEKLWFSALGSLIESAIKLHPSSVADSAALRTQLHDIVSGRSEVRVCPPLLLILQQGARTVDGETYYLHRSNVNATSKKNLAFGALIADPSAVFAGLQEEPPTQLIDAWTELIDWVFSPASVDSSRSSDWELAARTRVAEPTAIAASPRDSSSVNAPTELTAESSSKTETETEESDHSEGIISGDGVRFSVGKFIDSVGDASAEYWPGNTALNQMNIGIVGDLGTGKTQLLLALIAKIRKYAANTQPNPVSMLIFDYKKDFQSPDFLESVGGRVLRPYNIPLNIFELEEKTPHSAHQSARAFVNVLSKIYGGIGQVQANNLTEVIMDLYSAKQFESPTIYEILKDYKTQKASSDSIVAILNSFVHGEIFSRDLNDSMSFTDLLDNTVNVLALNQLGGDDAMKNSLVVLFLNKYYEYMLKLKRWDFQGEDPQLRQLNSFLIVDEAQNIMRFNFPVLDSILLQGRQMGTGVILSSQYLSHFKTSEFDYAQSLRTWFIHKVPAIKARELIARGLPEATPQDAAGIQTLEKHQAYYSSLNVSGRFIHGEPFYEYLDEGLHQ